MSIGNRNAILSIVGAFLIPGVLFAQSPPDPEEFMRRANQTYEQHMRCGVDLVIAQNMLQVTNSPSMAKFTEAMTQYMNRLLGVGAAVGKTHPEVQAQLIAESKSFLQSISASGSENPKAIAAVKERLDRSKECLVAIGYTTG